MLKIGAKAPAFNLQSSSGGMLSLKELAGRPVVIVFYPKNNTPGCDRQLAGLESRRPDFESVEAQVLAINSASVTAHENYCGKKGFQFPILSDPGEQVLARYKAQKPEGSGVLRTVYVVGKAGTIIFAERGQASYDDVLAAIEAEQ